MPTQEKKKFFAAYPHGIFVDGGALVLSQEKNFCRWENLSAHTRIKKTFAAGRAFMPTEEKN